MQSVSFRDAVLVWVRVGLLSFGGPAAQIALMHRIIVEEKHWLGEARFLHALNYCMLLPGPEAQQLATYVGWLLHGVKGGLVAGLLFILPGALAILGFSCLYVTVGDLTVVEGLFFGLKAAVLAIVVQALIRIGKRALKTGFQFMLAVTGFLSLFVFDLPFPLVVLAAGVLGYVTARWLSHGLPVAGDDTTEQTIHRPGTAITALACAALWAVTVLILLLSLGLDSVFTQIAIFFSKMASVTFGGAYAVLSYVAQQGVDHYQWLAPGEMLDGLGLAETTPGPLILVTQFVGFLAAFREAGAEPSLWLATAGAMLTTWVTFLPCFLWIFAGAPYVEKIRGQRALTSALAAITAVVVGVIANLAVWFAINALFSEHWQPDVTGLDLLLPVLSSVDLPMLALSCIAFVLAFGMKAGIIPLLGICTTLGVIWTVI